MAKRKMIQYNLIKNSIAAYFAAIEIHNKPSIAYRYESVTLLILNAWELALKAYIRKNIKHRSIFDKDNHTISLEKALGYVAQDINGMVSNSFEATRLNIERIKEYRDQIIHFYCDELEPYIFMLVARSALNYVDFMKTYFDKNVMADEGLFIIPLGFKLPFRPEDFLSDNVAKYVGSPESNSFIKSIVKTIQELDAIGIEESIVLGFDIYFENIKKSKNSDLLAAITSVEGADVIFGKVTHVKFTDQANATVVNMSDDEFRKIWKYDFKAVVEWCRANIEGFKQSKLFYTVKKKIENDINCAYKRHLDNTNSNSPHKFFYTEKGLESIREEYLKRL